MPVVLSQPVLPHCNVLSFSPSGSAVIIACVIVSAAFSQPAAPSVLGAYTSMSSVSSIFLP